MISIKKYRLEIEILMILLILFILIPACNVAVNGYDFKSVGNLLLVVNPLVILFTSIVYARYNANFYLEPIIASILYIPSVFAIYNGNYLGYFFLYLILGFLGGIIGYKFAKDSAFLKAFKEAVGVFSYIACGFIMVWTVLNNFLFREPYEIITLRTFFDLGDITNYLIACLFLFLGWRCLQKGKKKKKKEN